MLTKRKQNGNNMKYCEEKELQVKCDPFEIVISSPEETVSSGNEKCHEKLKKMLKLTNENRYMTEICGSKWQGVIPRSRMEDETLMKGAFNW